MAEVKCDHESNIERRSYAVVEHEAWDHRTKLGDFPLTVITNQYGAAATNDEERNSVVGQRGWYTLSPAKASQVVVESGHNVPGNEPDVVVAEVRKVLAVARSG